jgi:hypothetical protein
MSQTEGIQQHVSNPLPSADPRSSVVPEKSKSPISILKNQFKTEKNSVMALSTETAPPPTSILPKRTIWQTITRKVVKFGKFIGPGFMVSVAYIDPGNRVLNF